MGACRSKGSTCLGITQALTFPQDCFAGIVQIFTKLCTSVISIDWHELNVMSFLEADCTTFRSFLVSRQPGHPGRQVQCRQPARAARIAPTQLENPLQPVVH